MTSANKKPILVDFGFGDGREVAHRHRNPDGSLGGWVADRTGINAPIIDPKVYLGARVRVLGGIFRGGTFEGGTFWHGTFVKENDKAFFGPVGSRGTVLTLCRTAAGGEYNTGCFRGTYAQLHAACAQTHGVGSPHYEAYGAAATALWRIVMGDTPLPPVQE